MPRCERTWLMPVRSFVPYSAIVASAGVSSRISRVFSAAASAIEWQVKVPPCTTPLPNLRMMSSRPEHTEIG